MKTIKYTIIESYPNILRFENDLVQMIVSIYYYLCLTLFSIRNMFKNKINIFKRKDNVLNSNEFDLIFDKRELFINSNFNTNQELDKSFILSDLKSFNREFLYGIKAVNEIKNNYNYLEEKIKELKIENFKFLPNSKNFILRKETYIYNSEAHIKDNNDIINDNNQEIINYYITLEFNEAAIFVYNSLKSLKILKK